MGSGSEDNGTTKSQDQNAFKKVGPRVQSVELASDAEAAVALLPPPDREGANVPIVSLNGGRGKPEENIDNPAFQNYLDQESEYKRTYYAPQCYQTTNGTHLNVGYNNMPIAYNVDGVVHISDQKEGTLPLVGTLSMYELARGFSSSKFQQDRIALAGAAQAILNADLTRAFVVGAVLCLRQQPPSGDTSVGTPFVLMRIVVLRQGDGTVLVLSTELEHDQGRLSGLIHASKSSCGHLTDDDWIVDSEETPDHNPYYIRILKALRTLTWIPAKPLVAHAQLRDGTEQERDVVLKMAPPPAALSWWLRQTVSTEAQVLRDVQFSCDNKSMSLPRLVGSKDCEGWVGVVTEPLCSGDLSGDDNICENLEECAQTALNLFDTLIDALAQLHSTGWIHRDVFPGNIGNDEERFRLLDLGNAMHIDTAEVTEMRHVGTTKWCSMRAHAILNDIRGDSASWMWMPRDDLESVYFLFAERLSRQSDLTKLYNKCMLANWNKEHCQRCEDRKDIWSGENLQKMKKRLTLLQNKLFDKDIDAVLRGRGFPYESPNALHIRQEIRDFMVPGSQCNKNT